MAVIKHLAIHLSPLKFLKYILKNDKTEDKKLVTGLNCSSDVKSVYNEMKFQFEHCDRARFYKKSLDKNSTSKETIRLHHYIQSFKPNEVTPEEAHKIGVEWARKVFGNEHQVLVTTHVDRQHIHNHFAVAAYDLNGKRWHDNKTTLKRCRDISDSICKAHGLSTIEKPTYHADQKYSEWLERKNGTSWKQKLCDDIDRFVLRDDVRTVSDLAEKLARNGYEVRIGKYLSVKPRSFKKAIRTYRLGNGYAVEELQYRIENKNQELSLSEIGKLNGIQKEYALCLRELQITLYRKSDSVHNVTYRELRKNAELLSFLCNNKISSKEDFENLVNKTAEKTNEVKRQHQKLLTDIEDREKIIENGARYIELKRIKFPTREQSTELYNLKDFRAFHLQSEEDIEKYRQELSELKAKLPQADEELQAAENEKLEVTAHYQIYLQQMQTDYDYILRKMKREKEELVKREVREERAEENPEQAGIQYYTR